MSVSIDKAGQHGKLGQIDHLRPSRYCEARANRFDLLALDDDHLIGNGGPGFRIDKPPGFDRRYRRRGRLCNDLRDGYMAEN